MPEAAVAESPVGFFDSGLGGLGVRDAFARECPLEDTVYIADSANCPYGSRPPVEVLRLSSANVETLLSRGCKMVVVACNTATAAAIKALRKVHPGIPFVGVEPALKPAAASSKSRVVGVLATRGTFCGDAHYLSTKRRFARGVEVVPCVADEFVEFVERGETEGARVEEAVRRRLEPLFAAGADAIVLGCTHFPHLRGVMEKVASGRAEFFDPADAVARRAREVLAERGLLRTSPSPGGPRHDFLRTGI